MGVQEDVFSEFISILEQDESLPGFIIDRLKELWSQGELASKAELREAIDRGIRDATEN
jgi:hypothetical protein